jgi:CDGSH-type Zn-finger protein
MTERDKRSASVSRAAFCRCGHSSNKLFRDGTHARIGWRGDANGSAD